MAANRAALIETIKGRSKETSLSLSKRANLRLARADDSGDNRVRRMVDLASSLMREAQILSRDRAFADESAKVQSVDLEKGIDFYDEVQRFETALIKLALNQAAGNQAHAARLLGLRATTLNSKIKQYCVKY
jgi:transcriptional regulator with GAF, ATPase, and Fis domain